MAFDPAKYNREYAIKNADKIRERKKAQRNQPEVKEREKQYAKKYHAANRDHRNHVSRNWYGLNKKKVKIRRRKWARKNAGICVHRTRIREERIKLATPPWADLEKIKMIYVEADRISKVTGIRHHVDHVIPLNGKNVCGLHIEGNLQILTDAENCAKGNKFPDAGIIEWGMAA